MQGNRGLECNGLLEHTAGVIAMVARRLPNARWPPCPGSLVRDKMDWYLCIS